MCELQGLGCPCSNSSLKESGQYGKNHASDTSNWLVSHVVPKRRVTCGGSVNRKSDRGASCSNLTRHLVEIHRMTDYDKTPKVARRQL